MPGTTTEQACVGPIEYDTSDVRRDIGNLKAALNGLDVTEAFHTVVAPASAVFNGVNEFYGSEREYIFALAEALRQEYLEVHKAGLLYSHQTGPGRDGAGGIALTDQAPELGPGLLMVSTDPPQHTRYRKLVNSGFTPRMIRRLEDALRDKTNHILDRVTPNGECDFVVDVSAELPLLAIAEILGVPAEDRARLFDWSNRMIGSQDSEYGSGGETNEWKGTAELLIVPWLA